MGSRPPMPKPQPPAPTMKSAAPPPAMVKPEVIKEEGDGDDKLTSRKKKALEIKATKEGVKQFGAIDPASLPNTPSGGTNVP